MFRITAHARIELALGAVLLLGSCDSGGFHSEFTDKQRDEISDIANDGAVDPDEFATLKQTVDDLTDKVEANEQKADEALSNNEQNHSDIEEADGRLSNIESRLSM